MTTVAQALASGDVDSPRAWWRLLACLALITIGSSGMYTVVVVLPQVQAEFGVARADASLPYTLTLIGFGVGTILMGRLADRFGVVVPVLVSAASLGVGFALAAQAESLWQFALVHGVLIGLLGCAGTFGPLVADASLWFLRRRGIAVAICASGNYLAGAAWPPIVQSMVETVGWRQAYLWVALATVALMLPLALAVRRRPPMQAAHAQSAPAPAVAAASQARAVVPGAGVTPAPGPTSVHQAAKGAHERPLGMTPSSLQGLLCVAGVACCVAMSMPQVHIVAYCGDLGYGAARGAQMLSLMLAFGIVSRLASGVICDRIGGLRTLALGSALQMLALLLFLPFDSMASLYVISALFGLFQGGIVPSYAIIVREHFSPQQAGARIGTVLTATLLGMALGGWISGKIFDLTGSYDAAFVNGIGWNLLNLVIVLALIARERKLRRGGPVAFG